MKYTSLTHFRSKILLCCLLAVYPGVALGAPDDALATSTTSATTSESNIEAPARWFNSDFISGGDIAVGDFVTGPGNIEVTINPGETVTKMMTVTNRISPDKNFMLSVEDMSGSADPSAAVVLLGDKKGPYTLKEYISFPKNTFSLALGERAQIPVTITMPANAEPGGYYGAVLVSTVQDDKQAGNKAVANSPIVARIGTLFFITVSGPVEKSGQVNDFSMIPDNLFVSGGPVKLGILFENTGSVYLNPYGEVSVRNLFGEEVGFLNLDPWFVLPKSLRLREFTWDRELLLGRYTVTTKINRGYDNVIDEKTLSFWVIPWQFLLTVFGVLLSIFVLVSFIRSRFEFRRKVS